MNRPDWWRLAVYFGTLLIFASVLTETTGELAAKVVALLVVWLPLTRVLLGRWPIHRRRP